MDDTKRPQAGIYRNQTNLSLEGEGLFSSKSLFGSLGQKSAPMDPNCSAPETQAKAHIASSLRMKPAKDGNTVDKNRGIFAEVLATCGSSGQSSTATPPSLATDLEQEVETEKKKRRRNRCRNSYSDKVEYNDKYSLSTEFVRYASIQGICLFEVLSFRLRNEANRPESRCGKKHRHDIDSLIDTIPVPPHRPDPFNTYR